jgi:hypothetical protein
MGTMQPLLAEGSIFGGPGRLDGLTGGVAAEVNRAVAATRGQSAPRAVCGVMTPTVALITVGLTVGVGSPCGAAWSAVVQSGASQPHTREGQLRQMGPVRWGLADRPRSSARASIAGLVATPTVTVEVDHLTSRQRIHGFGGAFTEAAAYVWSLLPTAAGRQAVLDEYYGPSGIGYTTGRITMNSPDFALGHYSYANVTGDFNLSAFQHALPRDEVWVLPFLRAAIKTAGRPGTIRLFSAPWSPPAWMKVPFDDWPENQTQPDPAHLGAMDVCRPDSLLNSSDVRKAWALYFSMWHSAVSKQIGQELWGFSAQNEPGAHGHMWDCCGYTLASYNDFVSTYLPSPPMTCLTVCSGRKQR